MKKIGFILYICLIIILNTNTAPPKFPVVNPSFDCIEVDSNLNRFGNYDNKLFGIGWFDECAFMFNRFTGFGDVDEDGSYRNFVGPINIIRTAWWTLDNADYVDWCNDSINFEEPLYIFSTIMSLEEVQDFRELADTTGINFDSAIYETVYTRINSIDENIRNNIIIGWYTLDEPTHHYEPDPEGYHERHLTPDDFWKYNEIIRIVEDELNIDDKEIIFNPWMVVLQGFNFVNFIEYAEDPNVTIICLDAYPFYGKKYPELTVEVPNFSLYAESIMALHVDSYVNLMEYDTIDKPIFFAIQGNAHKNECPTNHWKRVASYAELRYQTYYVITQGVEGIFPWCARSLYTHEDYPTNIYNTYMDIHGWRYLNLVEYPHQEMTQNFKAFFRREETLVFGNIRTIFEEIEPYTEMLINNNCFDNVLYWRIFNPLIDSIAQDTVRSKNFVKSLFIKDMITSNFYLIAINNNKWFSGSQAIWDSTIKPQTIRFSFNDSLLNKSIKFIRQDPYKYDSSANWDSLEVADNIEIPVINNIKFYPDNYSGFTHPNEKYLYDYFGPGEVHVYKVLIEDYVSPLISNIIYTIDGKYRIDKFHGFDDVNTSGHTQFEDWFYSDLTCGADSNWSTYVDGGPWFNIISKYSLPLGADNYGNVYITNGLSRYNNNQGFDDINTIGHSGYDGWYYSDITIYYTNGDSAVIYQDAGPWHNIDSGYTLPMEVDGDGNTYVVNARSRYEDPLLDGFDDVPTWNPPGYQFFSGWYYSDITIYANDTTTYRDIGPWHNQELGFSLPFGVDGQGNIYVVNALGRYYDSLGFKPVDTTGKFPDWFHTDITIYNDSGEVDTILNDIGPWININKGYFLPFSVDKNGNIYVANGQVRLNQGFNNFDAVNTSGHSNYDGWHYSDIVIYNRSGVITSKLDAGPWHNIDSGYSLPMTTDGNGYFYVANAKSRYDDPEIDGFDDVNTAGHGQFTRWFYSDITVYRRTLFGIAETLTNRDRGPWHNMELGFSLPMVSTQNYINNEDNKQSERNNSNQQPLIYSLSQNYPNPFISNTTIEFFISRDVGVDINVYNILGQKVKSLISGIQPAGRYSLMWDRTNNHGQVVANGVYFYQLNIDNEDRITRKMLLVK